MKGEHCKNQAPFSNCQKVVPKSAVAKLYEHISGEATDKFTTIHQGGADRCKK